MKKTRKPLIGMTGPGLFCESGGFHIDPSRAVKVAVITHAHSDHARRGSALYLCHPYSAGLLRERLGQGIRVETLEYGERRAMENGILISLHPAGHILGSAQVRVEAPDGEVWVASGDYKRDSDPTCRPFEPVVCDTFITEATFGLPIYRWGDTSRIGLDIHEWWMRNAGEGRNSVLFGYSLGKSQRVLAELAAYTDRRVLVHPTITPLNACYRAAGVRMVPTVDLREVPEGEQIQGELVIVPPGAHTASFVERLGEFATAFASGWSRSRSSRMNSGYDRSFVLSDHADWPALLKTIEESRARQVFVSCRDDGVLVRHLKNHGYSAASVDALEGEIEALPSLGDWTPPLKSLTANLEPAASGLAAQTGQQYGMKRARPAPQPAEVLQNEFPFLR